MITLIALQSVVSIADAHQFHQSGTEHISYETVHSHDDDQALVRAETVTPEAASASQIDCQHCCHCHGTGQVILAMNQVNSFNNQLSKISSLYRIEYLSFSTTPDNPPPIS